jgi:methylenetetrahydrofolate reductase (NADPH)
MTGDYPTEGFAGRPKPVFDLDSVNTLKLIDNLNKGGSRPTQRGPDVLQATEFFAVAVVSPFKATEAELMAQYYKLQKKIASGARFIITQLGYDARKFEELRKYMDLTQLNTPLIGNIFVLSATVGKIMNKNMLPGCVVTDQMVRRLETEKAHNGTKKEWQLLRAAKLYGLLKGLKYNGVNIGGHGLDYPDIQYIIEKGEEVSLNWQDIAAEFHYPQDNGFYFFEKDTATGLNTNEPVDRVKTGISDSSVRFSFFSFVHRVAFDPESKLYPLIRYLAQKIDKSFLAKPFAYFEYMIKNITNGCQFCGNCVMHELGFICPMSQCPKQQRNGACGGSRDGWCEVYPREKKCIYVTMYSLIKPSDRDAHMGKQFLPCNWELHKTSSWLNYFVGRDPNCNKQQ